MTFSSENKKFSYYDQCQKYSKISGNVTDKWQHGEMITSANINDRGSLLTGFFSVVADDSGVNDGIQKLGRSLSRPPTMLDTLDVDAAC